MKRIFVLLAFALSLAARCAAENTVPTAPPPSDPVPTTAAGIAAQQGAEERYKRMAADMQALQLDNESLKAKIASLDQKIDDFRQQLAAAAHNPNTQDDLKRLAEKITEVDKKREEDKQAISEEIRKSMAGLERSVAGSSAPARVPSPRAAPPTETPATENGFSYTIQDGDTLSAVLKAYNADFKKHGLKTISLRQLKEANPNLDPARLLIGQKIIVPRPVGQ